MSASATHGSHNNSTNVVITTINQDDVCDAVIVASHCDCSPGSFDECRLGDRWL